MLGFVTIAKDTCYTLSTSQSAANGVRARFFIFFLPDNIETNADRIMRPISEIVSSPRKIKKSINECVTEVRFLSRVRNKLDDASPLKLIRRLSDLIESRADLQLVTFVPDFLIFIPAFIPGEMLGETGFPGVKLATGIAHGNHAHYCPFLSVPSI